MHSSAMQHVTKLSSYRARRMTHTRVMQCPKEQSLYRRPTPGPHYWLGLLMPGCRKLGHSASWAPKPVKAACYMVHMLWPILLHPMWVMHHTDKAQQATLPQRWLPTLQLPATPIASTRVPHMYPCETVLQPAVNCSSCSTASAYLGNALPSAATSNIAHS